MLYFRRNPQRQYRRRAVESNMDKPVTLNIYDLPGAEDTNAAMNPLGLGFYHSGVEINGYEYSFSTFGRTSPNTYPISSDPL